MDTITDMATGTVMVTTIMNTEAVQDMIMTTMKNMDILTALSKVIMKKMTF